MFSIFAMQPYARAVYSTTVYVCLSICCKPILYVCVCTGAKTAVKTVCGNGNGFEVKVGMH